MKKFLSTVLCLCMIISILPLQAVTATETETDTAILEKFGFSPDESTYDTNALKPGKHVLDKGYKLYADTGWEFQQWDVSKVYNSSSLSRGYSYSFENTAALSGSSANYYFASAAFDPTGCKAENYVAKAYLSSNTGGCAIKLCIVDSQGSAVIPSYTTKG